LFLSKSHTENELAPNKSQLDFDVYEEEQRAIEKYLKTETKLCKEEIYYIKYLGMPDRGSI